MRKYGVKLTATCFRIAVRKRAQEHVGVLTSAICKGSLSLSTVPTLLEIMVPPRDNGSHGFDLIIGVPFLGVFFCEPHANPLEYCRRQQADVFRRRVPVPSYFLTHSEPNSNISVAVNLTRYLRTNYHTSIHATPFHFIIFSAEKITHLSLSLHPLRLLSTFITKQLHHVPSFPKR